MRKVHRNSDALADLRAPDLIRAALAAHPQSDRLARAHRLTGLANSQLDIAALADNCVLGRNHHLDAPVELVGLAGQQGVHGSVEPERGGALRDVVDLAVGHHDDPRKPVRRGVGECPVEVLEQVGAGSALAIGPGGCHPAHLQPWDAAELGFEIGADRLRLIRTSGECIARALVQDHDGDVAEILALLLAQGRVGERQDECAERQRP